MQKTPDLSHQKTKHYTKLHIVHIVKNIIVKGKTLKQESNKRLHNIKIHDSHKEINKTKELSRLSSNRKKNYQTKISKIITREEEQTFVKPTPT